MQRAGPRYAERCSLPALRDEHKLLARPSGGEAPRSHAAAHTGLYQTDLGAVMTLHTGLYRIELGAIMTLHTGLYLSEIDQYAMTLHTGLYQIDLGAVITLHSHINAFFGGG